MNDFGPVFLTSPVIVEQAPAASEQPAAEENSYSAGSENYQPPESAPANPAEAKKEEKPLTLLQLKDGSQYGLTDYWLEDGRLHYITSYGGGNSVAFEQIDIEKTVQLNAERGVEFVLRPKPSPR